MVGIVVLTLVLAGCGGGGDGATTGAGGGGNGATTAGSNGMITRTTIDGTSIAETETSPSIGNTTPAESPSGTTVASPSFRRIFRSALNDFGIPVNSLTANENTVTLRYVSTATPQRKQFTVEVGDIATTYATFVDQGWDVKQLNATVVTPTGETVATWYVTSSWARQYSNGELSPSEFFDRIRSTVETPSSASGSTTKTNSADLKLVAEAADQ